MRILKGKAKKRSLNRLLLCANTARRSRCSNDAYGAIIYRDEANPSYLCSIVSRGFSSPNNSEHAVDRAIRKALKGDARYLSGSSIYVVKLDRNRNITQFEPLYCKECGELAFDVGIKRWVLWLPKGIGVLSAREYYKKSHGKGLKTKFLKLDNGRKRNKPRKDKKINKRTGTD